MSTLENQPAKINESKAEPNFGDVFAEGNAPHVAARKAGVTDSNMLSGDVQLASLIQDPKDAFHKALVEDTAAEINTARNQDGFDREGGGHQALVDCVRTILDEEGPEAVNKLPGELNSLLEGKKISFEKLPEGSENFLREAARQEGRLEADFIRLAQLTEGGRVIANAPIEMTTLAEGLAQQAGKNKKFDPKFLHDMSNEVNIRIERNAEKKDGVKKALDSFAQDVTEKLKRYPGKLAIEIVDDPELTQGLQKAARDVDKDPPTTVKHIRLVDKSIQLNEQEKAAAKQNGQDPAKMLEKKQTLDDSIFVHPSPETLRRRARRVA